MIAAMSNLDKKRWIRIAFKAFKLVCYHLSFESTYLHNGKDAESFSFFCFHVFPSVSEKIMKSKALMNLLDMMIDMTSQATPQSQLNTSPSNAV